MLGHIGLGDHFLTNGIVRHISENNKITFFCFKKYYDGISKIYSDNENIEIIPVLSDHEAINWFNSTFKYYDDTIIYGDFGKNFNSHNFKHDDIKKFDQIFYEQANVPYEYRWKKFKINRDFELENKIYEDLVKNENYCFIHEDKQRNYVIDKEFISKNLIHININNIKKEDLYFITDYYKIIKNCKEIHCIDSSFSCFIDNVDDFKNIPKYLHRYTRNVPNNPKYINNWNIIYENNIH